MTERQPNSYGERRTPNSALACNSPAAGVAPASSATIFAWLSRQRDYTRWAAWACGLASAILLGTGIALYCPKNAAVGQPPRLCVAEPSAPPAKSVAQLREEFDALVRENDTRQISVTDFSRGMNRILADCRALLARNDLPEANALHAQKLLVDGYGAVADYQKEFTAYVALAQRLARHRVTRTGGSDTPVSQDPAVAQQGVMPLLLWKAAEHKRAGQYLQAVTYYEEVLRRSATPEYCAFSLHQMGTCYFLQDLPQGADSCHRALVGQYADTGWAVRLLEEQAQALAEAGRMEQSASAYARIAETASTPEVACDALIAAGQVRLRFRDIAGARLAASEAATVALRCDEERRQRAAMLRWFTLLAECHLTSTDMLTRQ
jgi:tetratricopeptide (TPR) repeat protein